jgi:hypothetical protein
MHVALLDADVLRANNPVVLAYIHSTHASKPPTTTTANHTARNAIKRTQPSGLTLPKNAP